MKLYQWQADVLNGLAKGQMYITAVQRQAGKSMLTKMYMEQQMMFTSSYTDWKKTWVWPWNSKTSVFGKRIWGKINTRHCKISLNGGGSRRMQYATEREVFKKTIKDGKGW